MNLDQVPAGVQVFVDSNILVYHFQPHPIFGPMCHRFIERIERQDIEAFTSTSLLGELAHRLMVLAIPAVLVSTAATLSRQRSLLTNDALILALMQQHRFSHLASHDADFDRVPGITRYAPA